MSLFGFLKSYGTGKANSAANTAVEALVRWDPQGASEAQLREMERHLDALGIEVAKAKADADGKARELASANALLQQRIAAADTLQKQIEATADAAQKAAVEKSLESLLKLAETQGGEVEQLKSDAAEAEAFCSQMQAAYQEAGLKLKGAKGELDRAQHDMERARREHEAAERQAEAARLAAGLAKTPDSLHVATDAMAAATAKERQAAEAARAKAQLLAPSKPEAEDPNIAAAMAAASGKPSAPATMAERLAALKAKHG
jgi:chromosome segregation ATPase